ncbi:peptidase M23 [Mycolicibacterium sp. (ex Dasyatis americana)]|jgi:cell wall-associated NlpC family hydrolase|nr:NlpC/P60 family peptidoglycan endopeptidase RipA [Mycolicibacterium fortuitum]OBB01142.1 peptidase M23 [Mycolicibacterium fortuitum]OBK06088.1 peptidase M23 [Mycolicibacterium fortuitum]OBK62762.1 peptidase M23 [Mycolicibacterium fortuitum]OFB38038.1 peptidase M23 [Mycolicibacterium sp. (ex Dasyatis americana)]
MRPVRRFVSSFLLSMVAATSTALSSPVAHASHNGHDDAASSQVSAVVALAEANQRLAEVGARIQGQQEAVNKALLEVSQARDAAAVARRDADLGRQQLTEASAAIDTAQRRFDQFAAATYVNGPPRMLVLASSPDDVIAAAGADQPLTIGYRTAMSQLLRARTEKANQESAARAAEQHAWQALTDAQHRQDAAATSLAEAQRQFGSQQAEVDRLVAARDAARARLNTAPPTPSDTANWDHRRLGPADTSQWDTTLPMVPSANLTGDPVAIINAVLQISATSAQLTADMGRKFLTGLGILPQAAAPADPGFTNGRIPRVYGRQASEYVIRRAMSQLGVPYSWGGGNANGPSRGIDSGAGTVGFDCSGLYLYAFAGVGIKLDHYSGSQYNAGRRIPSAQMRRGDLIFYGPDASQHEAMYLGDGQMLEAPFTGSQVRVAPVRTSGMMPYVTRLIEY